MPRPRRDGAPTQAPQTVKLTEILILKLQARERPYWVYDLHQRGLSLQVQPTGLKEWKCIYSLCGCRRWFSIGSEHAVGLADARKRRLKFYTSLPKASTRAWVHRYIDTRPITYGSPEAVVRYCTKKDTDNFLRESYAYPSQSLIC